MKDKLNHNGQMIYDDRNKIDVNPKVDYYQRMIDDLIATSDSRTRDMIIQKRNDKIDDILG